MLKKEFVFVGVVLFVSGLVVSSFAQMECAGHPSGVNKQSALVVAPASVNQEKAVNVGNKICPVLGEKINEETKVAYEYEGKIYNLCCSSCIEEFKSNPEKFIQIVNNELKSNK